MDDRIQWILNATFAGNLTIVKNQAMGDGLELFYRWPDGVTSKVGEIDGRLVRRKDLYRPKWVRLAIDIAERSADLHRGEKWQ